MKLRKTWIAGFIIWVFAMGSIILAPQIRNLTYTKSQKVSVEAQEALSMYQATFDLLTEEEKFDVITAKKGIIMLDGESELFEVGDVSKISKMAVDGRIIHLMLIYELEPIDAEVLKQVTEKRMVERQLPTFQKRLLQSYKAVLLRDDDGQFFMVAGKQEALAYQKRYRSDCESCDSK